MNSHQFSHQYLKKGAFSASRIGIQYQASVPAWIPPKEKIALPPSSFSSSSSSLSSSCCTLSSTASSSSSSCCVALSSSSSVSISTSASLTSSALSSSSSPTSSALSLSSSPSSSSSASPSPSIDEDESSPEGVPLWCASRVHDWMSVEKYMLFVKNLFPDSEHFCLERSLYFLHACRYDIQAAIHLLRPWRPDKKARDEDAADDFCFVCGDGGNLILCDYSGCPKVYHASCVKMDTVPDGAWECPRHFCALCHSRVSDPRSQCSQCVNAYCSRHLPAALKAKSEGQKPLNFTCDECVTKSKKRASAASLGERKEFLHELLTLLQANKMKKDILSCTSSSVVSASASSSTSTATSSSIDLTQQQPPLSGSSLDLSLSSSSSSHSVQSMTSASSSSSLSSLSSSSSSSVAIGSNGGHPSRAMSASNEVYTLYRLIMARGGLDQVLRTDQWKYIKKEMHRLTNHNNSVAAKV
eukprot:TRINITY_DN1643_c0_g1_i1.p1 TRINITY_DN1643_c0_g1~~TRINITY_DN1643_c0_g1_i1.p1  ORF type:complete len:470 (+),score=195.62 TRINITY_DN1643_c0_g1_i1:62-1471(+)